MAFLALLLFIMTLFPTSITSNTLKDISSPHKLDKPYTKPQISFSTPVYNRRRYMIPTKSNYSTTLTSKVRLNLHDTVHRGLVMEIGIGSNQTSKPMLITELLIDTGSSFTWLQALPCTICYKQGDFPYYDRTTSTTYDPVYCNTKVCKNVPDLTHPSCDISPSDPCEYNLGYLDGANSSGVVGTETFYLPDMSQRRFKALEFVPFGLGTLNYLQDKAEYIPGVAGFDMYEYGTILSALEVTKFSHCFPRENSDTGVLSLGEEAKIVGHKVSLLTDWVPRYAAQLTNIFVSGDAVILEDDGSLPATMIFDTGSSHSILSPQLMRAFEEAIKYSLKRFTSFRSPTNRLCYTVDDLMSAGVDQVAKVTFEFGYTTWIDLYSYQIWERVSKKMMCLYFLHNSEVTSNNHGEINVFANNLMRDLNIGYTLDKDDLAMYFDRQHCRRS